MSDGGEACLLQIKQTRRPRTAHEAHRIAAAAAPGVLFAAVSRARPSRSGVRDLRRIWLIPVRGHGLGEQLERRIVGRRNPEQRYLRDRSSQSILHSFFTARSMNRLICAVTAHLRHRQPLAFRLGPGRDGIPHIDSIDRPSRAVHHCLIRRIDSQDVADRWVPVFRGGRVAGRCAV